MSPPQPPVGSANTSQVVLSDATVVDPVDGTTRHGHDILIRDGRIDGVRPAGEPAPAGADVVDAGGRYVVPGFNDLHAHPLVYADPSGSLALMLAHGITGVRQMSGSNALLARRDRLMPALAPRLLGMPGAILTSLNAGSTEAAIATIRDQHDRGADFVKAALVRRDVFFGAQAEARRLGIPILGHLPKGIDVARASGEGMRSIEHLGPGVGLLSCCAPDPPALQERAALRPERALPAWLGIPLLEPALERIVRKLVVNPLVRSRQEDMDLLDDAVALFDEDAAAALADRLAQDGTWQVPTLIRSRTQLHCDDPALSRNPNVRMVSPRTVRTWRKATTAFSDLEPAWRQTFDATYATLLRLTKLLDDADVPMLTGSDACGAAWVVPGASLHQEFDELGRAGLTPLRVLQMATCDAARFLGAEQTMGRVDRGKNADLVVLDADPLASIDNLHTVSAVVRGGRVLGRGELDALLERVAADPIVA